MIVSSDLINKIRYLHHKVKNKEWSGPLVYKIESGDINTPENLVLRAENMFLMDIGTSGSTSFEMDEASTIKMFDEIPQLMEGTHRTGLIHSHHGMKSFFSGTDNEELADNTSSHNLYLSLIVNYSEEFEARVAFTVTTKDKVKTFVSFTDLNNQNVEKLIESESEASFIGFYDCKIQIESLAIDDNFIKRYQEIESSNKVSHSQYSHNWNQNGRYAYNNNNTIQQHKKAVDYQNKYDPFFKTQIEKFCVKMIEQNKDSFLTFHQAFPRYTMSYHKDPEQMIDLVDDCMEEALGKHNYKTLSINEKFEFLDKTVEYLNTKGGSLELSPVDKYKGAEILSNLINDNFLDDSITDEQQLSIGFTR